MYKNYFYLDWVLKSSEEKKLLVKLLKSGEPCVKLHRLYAKHRTEIFDLKKALESIGAQHFTIQSELYPESLKQYDSAPFVITAYGDLSLLHSNYKITAVGSRNADEELKLWWDEAVNSVSSKYVFVSGGAYGVDQEVHKAALRKNRSTVFVLPSGLMSLYPKTLNSFFKSQKGRLFVSQFSPTQEVRKMNFYPRNQVLAMLGEVCLVLQANHKSGTMVTAQYALDLGKEILALSSAPWDTRYSGNRKLISDGAHQIMDLEVFHA